MAKGDSKIIRQNLSDSYCTMRNNFCIGNYVSNSFIQSKIDVYSLLSSYQNPDFCSKL